MKKKDSRGRPAGIPNKECSNCVYWSGERNPKRGMVHLDVCRKKECKVTSHHLCKDYVFEPEARVEGKKRVGLWRRFIDLLVKLELLEYRLYLRKRRNKKR